MTPLAARVVYCLGLCLLAACAALPEVAPVPPVIAVAEAPPSPEVQLAHAIRERIEVSQKYGLGQEASKQAAGAEACLRDYAARTDPNFHHDLIVALSNELAAALADRSHALLLYGDKHPELIKAETAVVQLTAEINAEVHHQS